MPITQEQIDSIRRKQREYVAQRLPKKLRKARSRSRFEKTGLGRLRKKSSSTRRWVTQSLFMDSITACFYP
ncbi:hypothetical protein [Caballeronia sp. DA-9]|uniref:hypothetical protein n=1 Tax=Caballeronia sp. DA-9 TaxID=3436237 RepID=UPI003F666D9A